MDSEPSIKMKRMWFNQPSTLQPLHRRHGERVLAAPYTDRTFVVYLLTGDVISMVVPRETLSEGWPKEGSSRPVREQ